MAAVGGVGDQAQEEVVVWAGAGAFLGDPLPHGQRAWPREGREWVSSAVCPVMLVQDGVGLVSPIVPPQPRNCW